MRNESVMDNQGAIKHRLMKLLVGIVALSSPFDGKFRKIRVEVRAKGKRNLKVQFSPKGYFAKKELLR